jgi:hypothetical protein
MLRLSVVVAVLPMVSCAWLGKNSYDHWRDNFADVCSDGIGTPAAQALRDFGQPRSDTKLTCGAVPCEEVEYWMDDYGGARMRLIFAPSTESRDWRLVECFTRGNDSSWSRFPFRPGS